MAVTQPTPSERAKPSTVDQGDKQIGTVVKELYQLSVDYAKQELVDPVKGLGVYLAWGIATMVLLGTGTLLLGLSLLRALQTETGSTFTGSLTWAPYAITFAVAIIVFAVVGLIVTREKKR